MLKGPLLIIVSVLIIFIVQTNAIGQTELPRFEFGGHFTFMSKFDAADQRAGELVEAPNEFTRKLNLGIGTRATLNLTRHISLETEWNALPQENAYSGTKSQWFYGLKVGIHKEKFGLFAKARPGYMYLSKDYCDDYPLFEDNYRCLGTYRKNPAFDIGGVLELYSERRIVVRIDIG